LRASLCVRCLLGVEKRGRVWAKEDEVKEVKEMEEAREKAGVGWMEEKVCGFGEDNMKEFSTELARR
jgi:hypothetical protein